jgi:hypothetical protein
MITFKDKILYKLENNQKVRTSYKQNRKIQKNCLLIFILLSLLIQLGVFYFVGLDFIFISSLIMNLFIFLFLLNFNKKLADVHVVSDTVIFKRQNKKPKLTQISTLKDIKTFKFINLTLTRYKYTFDGATNIVFQYKRINTGNPEPEKMIHFIQEYFKLK